VTRKTFLNVDGVVHDKLSVTLTALADHGFDFHQAVIVGAAEIVKPQRVLPVGENPTMQVPVYSLIMSKSAPTLSMMPTGKMISNWILDVIKEVGSDLTS